MRADKISEEILVPYFSGQDNSTYDIHNNMFPENQDWNTLEFLLKTDEEILDGIKTIFSEINYNEKLLLLNFAKSIPEPRAVKRAPVFYKQRDKSKYSDVVDFIKKEYGEYIGKGLCRADLGKLDPPLAQALTNWLRNNELPSDLDLPSKTERKNEEMARFFAENEDAAAVAKKVVNRLTSVLYRTPI